MQQCKPTKKNKPTLGPPHPPPEARAWLQTIGRRGAAVHSLNQEARELGVAVRKVKRALMAKGYSPEAALQKARARLHLSKQA